MRGTGLFALLLAGVVFLGLLMAMPAGADKIIINNYGAVPFVYGGFSYIPLRSAADFLGAALLWDSLKGRAAITYNGRELGLTVGSPMAVFAGAPVYLPAAPVIIDGRVFIPTVVVKEHFGVPVVWDGRACEVRILGPRGWGALAVVPQPPGHVIRILRQTPPWAKGPAGRLAPPPGLAGKPGGLPPGQAKKQTVVIIEDDKDKHRHHHRRGRGHDD